MGVDYALIHEETREAYELVRSNWETWEAAMPTSLDAVRERVARLFPSEPELAERASVAVWRFLETHPGCRVGRDTIDEWDTDPQEGQYREVGSMYEAQIGGGSEVK